MIGHFISITSKGVATYRLHKQCRFIALGGAV